MNNEFNLHPKMKESGVLWIGKVPNNWNIIPLKKALKRVKVVEESNQNVLSLGLNGIRTRDVSNNEGMLASDYSGHQSVYPGQLVFCPRDLDGGLLVGVSEYYGCISNLYMVLDSTTLSDNKFVEYLIRAANTCDYWVQNSYGMRYSYNQVQFLSNLIPLPPLHEQQAIANYLDEQVGKLDTLISEQKAAIDKWKAYKQSLITETVTKGLNPEVPMKDSGIEWIGEIPSEWEKRKISNLFNIIGSGTTPTSGDVRYHNDGTIPWLNTGDLNDGYLKDIKNKITPLALQDYSTLKMYEKDTLVVAMYGATIGKLGITTFSSVTNQACCALSNPKESLVKFVFYWFYGYKNEIINLSRGAGQPNISQGIIKKLPMFVPPIHEQQAIADFLDEKCLKIDESIEQKQILIKQLEEYKQSLIYECVTGKKQVI